MPSIVKKSGVREVADGVNVGSEVYEELNEKVEELVEEAVHRAEANGRVTVKSRDL